MLWKIVLIHAKQENCEINHVKMKLISYCSGCCQVDKLTPPMAKAPPRLTQKPSKRFGHISYYVNISRFSAI